jgi:penicillin-insensitive murein endopeptidase
MVAAESTPANPWARASVPTRGEPRAIGGYSAGCLQGGDQLPLDGRGFQVMRPARNRRFGHPDLTSFIESFAHTVHRDGLGVLLVGDLAQPRGGPAASGHSSHQSGLDADIWFWFPRKAATKRLSRRERERLKPRPIVSARSGGRTRAWSARVPALLRVAAADDRVSRVFVNPLIKRELCRATASDDRAWLRKIRPWWGHDWHFHVRLHCPADSPACTPQDDIPPGDGCGDIDWWLRDQPEGDRDQQRKRYQDSVGTQPELPVECAKLVE